MYKILLVAFLINPQPTAAREAQPDTFTYSTEHPRALEAVEAFYLERGYVPFWLDASRGRKTADILLDTLEDATSHGLSPERYRASELRNRVLALPEHADPTKVEQLDRALSSAYLSYADDMIVGAVNPQLLDLGIDLDLERPDPLQLLKIIARSRDVQDGLDKLAPRDVRYHKLRDAVRTLVDKAKSGGWGPPIKGGALKPGQSSREAEALRRRLIATGDLPPEPELSLERESSVAAYDDRLMEAVAKYQDRHGLLPDGIVGPQTLRALNQPIERRIAQAMLNLERLRWRSKFKTGRRIEVNQPAFRMTVFDEDDTPLHEARVIIGKQERRLQTPEFSRVMSYLVLNPRWTVPKTMMVREMLPAAKMDHSFFKRDNMILLYGGNSVDPDTIDWQAMTPEGFGAFTVVQQPGRGNALGNVKFMFPNGHNVYLHDTPTKHLFANSVRAYSHGCVRVERPFALAWLLLSEQSADPGAEIEAILATGEETEVPLESPIPIHLVYMTAWVDHNGKLNFRDDVYGRDEALARALQAESDGQQRTSGL